MNTKPITLEDLERLVETIDKIPPHPVEMHVTMETYSVMHIALSGVAVKDKNRLPLLGIQLKISDSVKFKEAKIVYNDGSNKIVVLF